MFSELKPLSLFRLSPELHDSPNPVTWEAVKREGPYVVIRGGPRLPVWDEGKRARRTWGVAVWVPEVERSHNGVSQLFRVLKFRH